MLMQKSPAEPGTRAPRLLLALWIAAVLLAAQGASIALPAFAASPIVVGGRAVVVNTDGDPIRVRQAVGTQAAQITSVYEGQIVGILAGPSSDTGGKSWFKVQAPSG